MNREFVISFFVSLVLLSLGFYLLHYEIFGYGISVFVFLPLILGYILGNKSIRRNSLIGFILSLIIFLVLLYLSSLEGMVCILMAIPLIFLLVLLGYIIRRLISNKAKKDSTNMLKSSILPFVLLIIIGVLEKHFSISEFNSVTTSIKFPFNSTIVFDNIKSVDTLLGEKPFLMKLDLPIPVKCILTDEKVGSLRICQFETGNIVERITEINRAKILKMDIVEYNLTGRKWLNFKEAIYIFIDLENEGCLLKRITTYTSELKPRFYWKYLEEMGIDQEHKYVLNNLRNQLNSKYQE